LQDLPENRIELSVITPVYKAEECLEELYRRLVAVLERTGEPFEIVMVNDGSPDDSWRLIRELASRDARVKGINLSRNFGQHYAITAGLDHCRGRFVVVMDCDLQHVPEDISRLYAKALDGYDIVLVRRMRRYDSPLKKLASRLFITVYNYLSDIKVDPDISSYSIISRRVVEALRFLREGNRTYPLLLHWIGYDVAYIDGEHAKRFAGKSAYSLAKSINLAIESVCSQSNRPLRLSIQFGFLLSLGSIVFAAWLAIRYFFLKLTVAGWTSTMVSLFFLSGLLFANIGVLGLYLGKVFDESKRRPLYFVKERLNLDALARANDSADAAESGTATLPALAARRGGDTSL
jgi:glycosyltransferase involved in cell wall biosynthesis